MICRAQTWRQGLKTKATHLGPKFCSTTAMCPDTIAPVRRRGRSRKHRQIPGNAKTSQALKNTAAEAAPARFPRTISAFSDDGLYATLRLPIPASRAGGGLAMSWSDTVDLQNLRVLVLRQYQSIAAAKSCESLITRIHQEPSSHPKEAACLVSTTPTARVSGHSPPTRTTETEEEAGWRSAL
jgi:hypothetical protein